MIQFKKIPPSKSVLLLLLFLTTNIYGFLQNNRNDFEVSRKSQNLFSMDLQQDVTRNMPIRRTGIDRVITEKDEIAERLYDRRSFRTGTIESRERVRDTRFDVNDNNNLPQFNRDSQDRIQNTRDSRRHFESTVSREHTRNRQYDERLLSSRTQRDFNRYSNRVGSNLQFRDKNRREMRSEGNIPEDLASERRVEQNIRLTNRERHERVNSRTASLTSRRNNRDDRNREMPVYDRRTTGRKLSEQEINNQAERRIVTSQENRSSSDLSRSNDVRNDRNSGERNLYEKRSSQLSNFDRSLGERRVDPVTSYSERFQRVNSRENSLQADNQISNQQGHSSRSLYKKNSFEDQSRRMSQNRNEQIERRLDARTQENRASPNLSFRSRDANRFIRSVHVRNPTNSFEYNLNERRSSDIFNSQKRLSLGECKGDHVISSTERSQRVNSRENRNEQIERRFVKRSARSQENRAPLDLSRLSLETNRFIRSVDVRNQRSSGERNLIERRSTQLSNSERQLSLEKRRVASTDHFQKLNTRENLLERNNRISDRQSQSPESTSKKRVIEIRSRRISENRNKSNENRFVARSARFQENRTSPDFSRRSLEIRRFIRSVDIQNQRSSDESNLNDRRSSKLSNSQRRLSLEGYKDSRVTAQRLQRVDSGENLLQRKNKISMISRSARTQGNKVSTDLSRRTLGTRRFISPVEVHNQQNSDERGLNQKFSELSNSQKRLSSEERATITAERFQVNFKENLLQRNNRIYNRQSSELLAVQSRRISENGKEDNRRSTARSVTSENRITALPIREIATESTIRSEQRTPKRMSDVNHSSKIAFRNIRKPSSQRRQKSSYRFADIRRSLGRGQSRSDSTRYIQDKTPTRYISSAYKQDSSSKYKENLLEKTIHNLRRENIPTVRYNTADSRVYFERIVSQKTTGNLDIPSVNFERDIKNNYAYAWANTVKILLAAFLVGQIFVNSSKANKYRFHNLISVATSVKEKVH